MMQLEFALDDWRTMDCAPTTGPIQYVEVTNGKETQVAHFACDLSGECQPPFQGWFYAIRNEAGKVMFFNEITKPKFWRPLSC